MLKYISRTEYFRMKLNLTIIACSLVIGTFCFGKKPNFILIFTDDQGYGDLSCFGSDKIKTPNIDRIAKEGRKFTNFMVASPVCTPSRAALMTGCYPSEWECISMFFFQLQKKGLILLSTPWVITFNHWVMPRHVSGNGISVTIKKHCLYQTDLIPTMVFPIRMI